ncbi:MAG: RidA family protein, partial [Firmicutes bacterium]|nr:RidA family protein [Bacillota bacterium]
AAGTTKDRVAMCRVYIPDMALWDEVNDIYAEFFGDHKPARVVVPTRNLHHGVLIEIEATAEMPEQDS